MQDVLGLKRKYINPILNLELTENEIRSTLGERLKFKLSQD